MTTNQVSRVKLANQSSVQGYLSKEEIEWIIQKSKELRQGQKKQQNDPLFLVMVDGKNIRINTAKQLKNLLGACYIYRKNFEMFRNYMKSITIKLDECC